MTRPTITSTAAGGGLRASLIPLCAVLALALFACDAPAGSPRPSPSLVELDFTPLPTVASPGSPSTTAGPTLVSWPVGWDVKFCDTFAGAVVAQELVVDVERAMDEDATEDALALARELSVIATGTAQQLTELPAWDVGRVSVRELAKLMDLGQRAGGEYTTYLDQGGRGALRRARTLRREIEAAVPEANQQLEALARTGLACPGLALELESP